MAHNIDERVAESFGDEWQRFDQVALTDEDGDSETGPGDNSDGICLEQK